MLCRRIPHPTLATTLMAAGFALTMTAGADLIGPWPTSQPYLWSTNPFSPVCGIVYQQPDALNNLVMGSFGSGSKNGWWLPYGSITTNQWAERMCMARLAFSGATPVTNIHAKILDQATSQKHGWAIIFKDSTGRILDFGVRPFFRPAMIAPRQWDGTSWTNYVGSDSFTPQYARSRYGADYYTMDFAQNGDGTISWTLVGFNAPGGTNFLTGVGTTVVTYGPITEIYLNASTTDTSYANYKWTEFNVLPQVYSPPALNLSPSVSDLVFSWRSQWNTFGLQANPDLNTTTWTNVPDATSDDGTNVTVIIPIGPGNLFFRLVK